MSENVRFDGLSGDYEELLRDPIRDRFTGAESAFFHERKRDLILDYYRRRDLDTTSLSYLDVGCGKGELLTLLRPRFQRVSGCDVSAGMMHAIKDVEVRFQPDPRAIPFPDASFDFITAVCVYHHVTPADRSTLTTEIVRALKPGGVFCVLEHNPLNPATRLIVSRTPVDADAILLRAGETRTLLRSAGMESIDSRYFLYFPKNLYRTLGALERTLSKVPLGGQYGVFGIKPL